MSTETAKITGAKPVRHLKTGETYLEVEVAYNRGRGDTKAEEVRKYAYPLGSTTEEIEADIAKSLKTRAAEREQAEAEKVTEADAAETEATVAALEGTKVTQ